jgi:hypothetical protein
MVIILLENRKGKYVYLTKKYSSKSLYLIRPMVTFTYEKGLGVFTFWEKGLGVFTFLDLLSEF